MILFNLLIGILISSWNGVAECEIWFGFSTPFQTLQEENGETVHLNKSQHTDTVILSVKYLR